MRAVVCLALAFALTIATASCTQFVRFDGGDDDDASSRDGRADVVVASDVAAVDSADAADTVISSDVPVVDSMVVSDATDAPDATDVQQADTAAADVPDASDALTAPDTEDVSPSTDTGCGGFSGASCCPGTGASRCNSQWFGCYGGACHCGGVDQVCCRTGCNTGLRCGAVIASTCGM